MAKKDIPKKIHFIWVGGGLRPEQFVRMRSWAWRNPHYEINLWYDSKHLLANTVRMKLKDMGVGFMMASDQQVAAMMRMVQKTAAHEIGHGGDLYRKSYLIDHMGMNEEQVETIREQMADSIDLMTPSGVVARDVRTLMDGSSTGAGNVNLYENEMVERGGNFGAASDILRVEVLIKFGGIYMDIDIGCRDVFPTFKVDKDLALFGRYSVAETDQVSGLMISNGVIAGCPDSKMLVDCRDKIKQNYFGLMTDQGVLKRYYEDMRQATVSMTGPTLVKSALQAGGEKKGHPDVEGRRGEFETWKDEEVSFPNKYILWETPEAATHDWIA